MTLPIQDLLAILPELVVIGTACLILVLDPILPTSKKDLLVWLMLAALAICLGLTLLKQRAAYTPSAIWS